jgi:phage shock protein E
MRTNLALALLLGWLGLMAAPTSFADSIWIDVRSAEEYRVDHISGDPNILHTEIVASIGQLAASKDSEIVLYCRSGGRAEKARKALLELGYSNVRNVGSIDDARRERGCTAGVTGQGGDASC